MVALEYLPRPGREVPPRNLPEDRPEPKQVVIGNPIDQTRAASDAWLRETKAGDLR